jgi:hypothetical protein
MLVCLLVPAHSELSSVAVNDMFCSVPLHITAYDRVRYAVTAPCFANATSTGSRGCAVAHHCMICQCQHCDLFNKVFAVRFVGLQLLLHTTVGPMHARVFVPFFTACSRDLLSVL